VARKHACPYVANIQENIVGRRCCWADTNHPNELGNRHVADMVEPILQDLLGVRAQPIRKPILRTTRDFWDEALALAPDRSAVVDGDRRLTYAEAGREVDRVAAGLSRVAGTSCPKVAVFLPNCLEYYLVYWAVARLGGVVVPLNTWLKREELASIFENVQPDVLVLCSTRDAEALAAARACAPTSVVLVDERAGDARSWRALLAGDEAPPRTEIEPDALSIVMHTSGTTGAPKGAMMRHSDLMFNVMAAINAHQFSVRDIHLLVNPMFHCTALYSLLPTAAYTKTPVVIASSTHPGSLMAVIARERITTFLSVPSVFQQVLKLPDLSACDVSSLRLIAYAGSPMPVSTIRKLRQCFPDAELHNFFGLTETISMTHVLTGEEADERPESIGRLLPFVEARITGQSGAAPAPGAVGELLFARENVIAGYYNQPARLGESLKTVDGRPWFRTGDLATVDEEGYFFIKGRGKDMIIVGGENVYAAEIEWLLLANDKVAEAAVKGIPATGPAAFLGERIMAYVVREDDALTETELRRYCFERVPSYKVPYRVLFLDALPRNPAGKVVKAELP